MKSPFKAIGTMEERNPIKASLHPRKKARDAGRGGGSPAAAVSTQHAGIVVDAWIVVCVLGMVAGELMVFCPYAL